jgi:glutaredoxin
VRVRFAGEGRSVDECGGGGFDGAPGIARQDEEASMTDQAATPTLYLKKTCPFCLKLRIFLTEAGIADRFNFTVFDDGDETHKALRARMEEAGQQPSFPAAEFTPGKLETGTDDLIARFAGEAGVDPATMPLLNYYQEGVFKQVGQMFRELRELKSKQPA